ncbi:hypothetical protein TWF788_005818 [Orbilia oligospora]|uniref:Uncharacterized protein n=1 Tax=Orbilia oligospora TaxID=2813651 RepID=A0A7C8TW19_ORBOL|nr:hypothetical protein TWF788_005818 [Orbilia oligospora]KAF3197779.1 hypothetical protein TWF679_002615 [Orbilia oligospora]KAF3209155.1 hypothetical protein TWF191_000445 [Orbilia oligospora]
MRTYFLFYSLSAINAIAYEIAFNSFDLENDLPDHFSAAPTPEFNWSVYPRYRCNPVNYSGSNRGYLRDVLVRTLPGGDGPPDIIVLYNNKPGVFDKNEDFDFNEPCSWKNARGIVRFKDAFPEYLSRGVGNSQRYNMFYNIAAMYWRELDLTSTTAIPEPWGAIINRLEPGKSAIFWRSSKDWEIIDRDDIGLPQQRGVIYSGGYFTDYWYLFSEYGASLLLGTDDTDPDASEEEDGGEDGGNRSDERPNSPSDLSSSSGDEVASLGTAFTADQNAVHEFVEREDYPWQPPPPRIIKNNPRWILRPTRRYPMITPEYRIWRNGRIIKAGDYRPIATISADGVEDMTVDIPLDTLIAEGWIIDKEAEAKYQEKLKRERLGVREAEIFYQILTEDEKSQRLGQGVYDKIWEQEDPGWKPTNPLQLLMSLNADEPEIIPGEQQQDGQVNMAQPQAADPNLRIQTAFRPPACNRIHDFLSGPGSPA